MTCRWMLLIGILAAPSALGQDGAVKGWKKGTGWGWIWGKADQVGALNAMVDASRLAALREIETGKVYDLGVPFTRNSYKWPGHNPTEVMTFRSPEGVKRQRDVPFVDNKDGTAWHSCALFISDNVGTQIDGLGHATTGKDNHWYNGFTESQWGGNWGVRKCDATTIPPVITRGVLIDVATSKNLDALPSNYGISPKDLKDALRKQNTTLRPGDTVLIRTGVLRYWGEDGADHEKIAKHDSAGITLASAKWLVEQHGAIMIGADTSGLEVTPTEATDAFIPVHKYLLIEQGVHIAELHNLEALARDKVYTFCYIGLPNNIRGATAGFTMRPIAIH